MGPAFLSRRQISATSAHPQHVPAHVYTHTHTSPGRFREEQGEEQAAGKLCGQELLTEQSAPPLTGSPTPDPPTKTLLESNTELLPGYLEEGQDVQPVFLPRDCLADLTISGVEK